MMVEAKTYRFRISRTLIAEIEIDATDITAAKAQAKEHLRGMADTDFAEINEETIQLIAGPEGEDVSEEQGIETL